MKKVPYESYPEVQKFLSQDIPPEEKAEKIHGFARMMAELSTNGRVDYSTIVPISKIVIAIKEKEAEIRIFAFIERMLDLIREVKENHADISGEFKQLELELVEFHNAIKGD